MPEQLFGQFSSGLSCHSTELPVVRAFLFVLLTIAGSFFGVQEVEAQQFKSHTVELGDTLYRIARTNLVTVQSLRSLNQIENDHIEPGQILWIDGRPAKIDSVGVTTVLVDGGVLDSSNVDIVDAAIAGEAVDSTPQEVEMEYVSYETIRDRVEFAGDSTDVSPVDSITNARTIAFADSGVGSDRLATEASNVAEDVLQSDDAQPDVQFVSHIVDEGETLFSIATLYDVSTSVLSENNPELPTFLSKGDSLKIPWGTQLGKHRVSSGETLFRISRKYGTSVSEIQNLNDLANASIRVGQQLIVPLTPSDVATHVQSEPKVLEVGVISIYPEMFEGRLMANGKSYIPEKFTVSHGSLPLGTLVLLVDPATGRQSFAEVTDRLPSGSDVVMEVSRAVYSLLGIDDPLAGVEIRSVR